MEREAEALHAYHLNELEIARTPGHPGRVQPTFESRHRSILDVGCGAGQTLIAAGFDTGRRLVAVDVDPRAVQLGRSLEPRIGFAAARGEALPFADRSFDLVFCRVALPYMNVPSALREMARVLRPGGDVWLLLHPVRQTLRELASAAAGLRPKDVLFRFYVLANGLSLHLFGQPFSLPMNDHRHESFQTAHAMRRCLDDAGFEEVRFERGRFFVATARRARPSE